MAARRTKKTQRRADTAHTPSGRRRTAHRLQKTAAVRLSILESAAQIIGRYGYAGCSISRVTTKAKVAHGAFYLHFDSQQDLFDEVIPWLVERLREAIAHAIHKAKSIHDLEALGLKANIAFLESHPYLQRVLHEGEIFAPKAYQFYLDDINRRYSHSLATLIGGRTPLTRETRFQYEAAADMLSGARGQLLQHYAYEDGVFVGIPDKAVQLYLRFVTGGIDALFRRKQSRR
jgi:AcrR family transcriptional regulator